MFDIQCLVTNRNRAGIMFYMPCFVLEFQLITDKITCLDLFCNLGLATKTYLPVYFLSAPFI